MRLTLVNQFYPPELAPTGYLAESLAAHRANEGDQVLVITSRGGYVPESGQERDIARRNPAVIRIWTPKLGKRTFIRRAVDYGLFLLQSAWRMMLLPPQDVIVSLTTPPLIAWTAVLHKVLSPTTRLVLWTMDCYPEVLESAGVLQERSLMSRMLRSLNRQLFRRLDHLVVLDEAMKELLLSRYPNDLASSDTTVINNWEPLSLFPGDATPDPWIPPGGGDLSSRFVILYLGNAGYGHQFETVLEAASQLQADPIAFVFVGGGRQWRALRAQIRARSLSNVHLFPYVSKETTGAVMAMADCALITLRDEFQGVISPSKLHSNLAMGMPVIYVGPSKGNVAEALERYGCGASLRSGETERLVSVVRKWMNNDSILRSLSMRARLAYEESYSDQIALPKWDKLLEELGEGDRLQ